MSLSSIDELGAQPFVGHSTCVVEERQMVDEIHLVSHYYDGILHW